MTIQLNINLEACIGRDCNVQREHIDLPFWCIEAYLFVITSRIGSFRRNGIWLVFSHQLMLPVISEASPKGVFFPLTNLKLLPKQQSFFCVCVTIALQLQGWRFKPSTFRKYRWLNYSVGIIWLNLKATSTTNQPQTIIIAKLPRKLKVLTYKLEYF